MAIKESPIRLQQYFKQMRIINQQKIEEADKSLEELEESNLILNEFILKHAEDYKQYDININDFEEIKDNIYISGKLLRVAKSLFINRKDNYTLVSDIYDLYKYARQQFQIHSLKKKINFCNKLLGLTFKEYSRILNVFYTEVHKKLILEGAGYKYGNGIGWICINRVKLGRHKPMVDFALTRKREKELIAQGKRIWNKEEADWCKRNGIEYIAEDKRVFRNDEYIYEIPLLFSTCTNGTKIRLEISDFRGPELRGKTNDMLLEECNNDITKICSLKLDIKTKLTLCNKADKSLHIKYIRNENQSAYKYK